MPAGKMRFAASVAELYNFIRLFGAMWAKCGLN